MEQIDEEGMTAHGGENRHPGAGGGILRPQPPEKIAGEEQQQPGQQGEVVCGKKPGGGKPR